MGRKRSGRDVRGIHRSSGGGRGCSISIVRRSRGADCAASTENFILDRHPRNPEFSIQAGDDNCPLSEGRFLRRGPRAFARITRAIAGRGDRANPRYDVTIGSRDPSAEPDAIRGDTARHAAGALHGKQVPSGEEDRGKKHTLALGLETVLVPAATTRVERTARTALTGATTGVPTRVDMANIFVCC